MNGWTNLSWASFQTFSGIVFTIILHLGIIFPGTKMRKLKLGGAASVVLNPGFILESPGHFSNNGCLCPTLRVANLFGVPWSLRTDYFADLLFCLSR